MNDQMAVRTWKRDGSQNFMTVAAAILNLELNLAKQRRTEDIAKILYAGQAVETKHAKFNLTSIFG